MNWVEHVKKYAADKNMKYNEAMKSQECKDLYHKNKTKTIDDVEKVIIKSAKGNTKMLSKASTSAKQM